MSAFDTLVQPLKVSGRPEEVVRRAHEVLARHGHDVPVRLWTGERLGALDAAYSLVLRHPWSLRAMLVPPNDLSAGEAYLCDDIDVEGSMADALHAMRDLRQHADLSWRERTDLARLVLSLPAPPEHHQLRRARLSGRLHTKERDNAAVRFHYDVGNDFYRLFLDENLVYSCGYFGDEAPTDPEEDPTALDRAQVRKLDMVCRKLRLREGKRLLDIGCGWGSLVLHAAVHYGVEAVGITLSEEQAALARQRLRQVGVSDRVEIRVEDYRDTEGTFDAVASIGMFEHVGESQFSTYFARAHELTAPDGLFLNHAITTGRRMAVREVTTDAGGFAGAYVFPDSTIAPAHVAVRLMEETGLEVLDVQQLRRHYARTLRHWLANLQRNADAVRAEAGDTVYRIWRAYMSGAAVGFDTNDMGVIQVLGAKGEADVPLGRSWMAPVRP